MQQSYQSNKVAIKCFSSLKRSDGTTAESDTEKAKELNSFFKDVFVSESKDNIPTFGDRSAGNSVETLVINEHLVKRLIEKLNCNKSGGPDLLHPRVLKELCECISNDHDIPNFR